MGRREVTQNFKYDPSSIGASFTFFKPENLSRGDFRHLKSTFFSENRRVHHDPTTSRSCLYVNINLLWPHRELDLVQTIRSNAFDI